MLPQVTVGRGRQAKRLWRFSSLLYSVRRIQAIMAEPEEAQERAARKERRWAVVRLLLGQFQMIGAVVSLYLLVQTGMSELALGTVLLTCLFTTASVLLFGRERD